MPGPKRRLLVPEVIQTSMMDCGPASLKALLEGFHVAASYGRLREACQTDVDGTSIDTLEEIARQLGLEATQMMVPIDHLLLEEAEALPAIVVVRLAGGLTHFVVVWRTHAGVVQVMDPATGRRWPTREAFLREVYVHQMTVPASAWREFAGTPQFLGSLRARARAFGAGAAAERLLVAAAADPEWRSLAAVDAATRMTSALVSAGGISRGDDAARVLSELTAEARTTLDGGDVNVVPRRYFFALPADAETAEPAEEEQVRIAGAVLVQIQGLRKSSVARDVADTDERPMTPELLATLREAPSRPAREMLRALRADGLFAPSVVILAFSIAALGTAVEAVLFRSLFDIGRQLDILDKRAVAFGALLLFLTLFVVVEVPLASITLRMGRRLEGRFRVAFLEKLPRLGDRYFQSRPISDMADRSHGVHALRILPGLVGQFLRETFALATTTLGIAYVDPRSAPLAVGVTVVAFAVPLLLQRPLDERDLRVRSHGGALSGFYLDALLGLVPLRVHGAEAALRREHENVLVEWIRASRSRDRLAIAIEGVQAVVALAIAGSLFLAYYARVGQPSGALLILYWSLSLPAHGRDLALTVRQYPAHRNTALRLLEPLGALEETEEGASDVDGASAARKHVEEPARGAALRFEGVSVRAGGHSILEEIDLTIDAGEHVAIVGASGAGKSSLVGILLGWHRAAAGRVLVDGEPLRGATLDALRASTAWVDPAVQIWNRPLLDNLLYGASETAREGVGSVIERADLRGVLENLPDGLATVVGEGGGLVSGGEGQRVRLGRAALRADARLVILDEPFRGLDRERRRELLGRARRWWPKATLLCITHDVGETKEFERVIVIDRGRVAEDGHPADLGGSAGSEYAALLAAEADTRKGMWTDASWRRLRLEVGVVHEEGR